jgi:hypothetical protein
VSTAGLTPGDYVAVVEATSVAGHTLWLGQAPLQALVRADVDPPVISIAGVADGGDYPAAVTPVVTVTDESPVATTITLDGLPFESGTPVSAEGAHVLLVLAVDAFDNASSATATFTIDTIVPVITIAGVQDSQCGGSVVPVVTFVDDHLAATTLTLDGQPFESGTPVGTDGAHTLVATVTDLAGNTTIEQVTATTTSTGSSRPPRAMPAVHGAAAPRRLRQKAPRACGRGHRRGVCSAVQPLLRAAGV